MLRVDTIESIEDDALSLVTVDGVILATLSNDTIVLRYAAGSLEDLSVGQRVSFGGQRTGEEFAARQIAVSLEGTGFYIATRVFETGGAFVGMIEAIDGPSITVNAEEGSFVATVDLRQTSIQIQSVTSIEDLSVGQLLKVIGRESEEGGISATSIVITPDLGELLQGKQGPTFDQERNAGENEGITFLSRRGLRGDLHGGGEVGTAAFAKLHGNADDSIVRSGPPQRMTLRR